MVRPGALEKTGLLGRDPSPVENTSEEALPEKLQNKAGKYRPESWPSKKLGISHGLPPEDYAATHRDPPGGQRLRLCYDPVTIRSKRGLPRSGAKLGSILSQPGER